MDVIDIAVNAAFAVFALWESIYFLRLYTGRIKLTEDEERRKKKYKYFLIVCNIVLFFAGIGLLLATMSRVLKYFQM